MIENILKFLKYAKKNNFDNFFKINLVVGPLNENFKRYRAYINNNNLKISNCILIQKYL